MTPTSEEIFYFQFVLRRKAFIRAFTEDLELLVRTCDPSGEEAFCLYGYPTGTWKVAGKKEFVPCKVPEPCCGINWQMNSMSIDEWINSLAMRSDSWLLRVISAVIGHLHLDREERGTLYKNICRVDTILEEVTCYYRRNNVPDNVKELYDTKCLISAAASLTKLKSDTNNGDQAHKGRSDKCYHGKEHDQKRSEKHKEEKLDAQAGESSEDYCGLCSKKYGVDEFWICCDLCERWFHGDCVRVTKEEADLIKKFKCPLCKQKKRL